MGNSKLHKAKAEKNDEFYTQYYDIEREMNAYLDYNPDVFRDKVILCPCDDPEWSNFTKYFAIRFDELGLKKLISTSYAPESKNYVGLFSLIDIGEDGFDENKAAKCGKIFILDRDRNGDGRINYEDLEWDYLEGNGDFRSEEVTKLRDESDFIITNPPFSLFREFIAWIMAAPEKKQFAVIGSMNAITYKDIFPYIGSNQMWLGRGFDKGNAYFEVGSEKTYDDRVYDATKNLVKFRNCVWFTNIEHGRRHEPLRLMNMADNVRFNPKMKKQQYQKYDNYDAIEVPSVSAIPSDYDGVMGVPITFLDKYNPDQFEIVLFVVDKDGVERVVPVMEVFHTHTHTHTGNSQNSISCQRRNANYQRSEIVQENLYTCKTAIPGMIKNDEGKIQGHITYARITIRHKKQ